MIVLEKWDPKKPISAIYWEGEKELFYVKRFLIDNPDKEESIITEHPKSYLERVFTDYLPMAEVVFVKDRGKERKDNLEINLEEFIAVKGINAMGNQLTKEKVLEINPMESLPYEAPEPVPAEEIDVVDEEDVSGDDSDASNANEDDQEPPIDEEGQTMLF
jgi:topoisomerase-4 subunit A